jgi:hypothetical protein
LSRFALSRHLSIPEQHAELVAKTRGHYAYDGISGILHESKNYSA